MGILLKAFQANAERDLLIGKLFSTLVQSQTRERKQLIQDLVKKHGDDPVCANSLLVFLRELVKEHKIQAVGQGFIIAAAVARKIHQHDGPTNVPYELKKNAIELAKTAYADAHVEMKGRLSLYQIIQDELYAVAANQDDIAIVRSIINEEKPSASKVEEPSVPMRTQP